ncbi:MAG: NPCBM/NEW2 domain-containing protein [Verrucomicrobia bacterium]|nr:NPCBM/NEW2 domain-containing protein [Verrucomicrobiota bacterium]
MKFPLCFEPSGSGRAVLGCLASLALGAVAADAPLPTVEWLSDHPELLVARSQQWGVPGFDTAAHDPQKAGEPLRIGAQAYARGVGHHAHGKLVILLGGEFERFEADVGVQPCAGGSVIFRVLADGRMLFDSGVMRSGEEARRVRVPVAGAQELVLEAQDAGDGIACDMANWADARLLRVAPPTRDAADQAVDVARFAAVVTSNPQRLEGTAASRLHEFPAEDVFQETPLAPEADGNYRLAPDAAGMACIGLNWAGKRVLRELRLRLADGALQPGTNSVRVQGWFGESAWQGRWMPLEGTTTLDGGWWVTRLSPKGPTGDLLQTRKVRWLLRAGQNPVTVRPLEAYTRTRWADTTVVAEAENPVPGARGRVRVLNGECLDGDAAGAASAGGWRAWDMAAPLSLRVRYSRPSPLKGDATLLQFHLPAGGVGVGLEDLLASNSVHVPSRGLFVSRADPPAAPPTLAEYRRRVAGRKTVLDEVRRLPDQTLAQALARTHRAAQDEGPVMLSLACDNTKYVVDRAGTVHYPVAPVTRDDWFASAGQLQPVLGDGAPGPLRRRLEGGWLPIPEMTWTHGGLRCTERVLVAPADDDGPNPSRLNRAAVCVAEFIVDNLRDEPAPARLELRFRQARRAAPAAELKREGAHRIVARLGMTEAAVVLDEARPLTARMDGGSLTLAGTLPGRARSRTVVFLGAGGLRALGVADVARLRAALERYWGGLLDAAMRIETPDDLLNRVIRSSRVRCWIAARNEAEGARVAPWIAAMSYGPLESEAHSVIRGMDFLGHHEFARRGLEYFMHRYHTNGFLTTGYTTFGTGWHLWTLGEHARLTGDRDWLRRHAPELRRVGDWILRQLHKTKRVGLDGQPVPEFGLMPPGVMADWNAFAFHFTLNGYYHAALRELGAGLGGIGDPRARLYSGAADELRRNVLRAYRWTQAQSPALPLRDGTWIPFYPSQVHSPGKLEHFFPGEDAGRSWAYDVELGAHQLVPTGVFAPDDPEVTQMLNHLEDVQFLGEGWFDYPAAENAKDWFHLGGFAKVQPFYCRHAEILALRDDVKPFLRSYFNSLASLLNTEVLTLWEHFRHSGAWDKTHETGYFLHQTRTLLVQERGNRLWLAPLIPDDWLRDGATLDVRNAPTAFGPVSYRLASRDGARTVQAEIVPPTRTPPARVVLRLRPPAGRTLRSVEVNGRPHREFDPREHTITLEPGDRLLSVTARLESSTS